MINNKLLPAIVILVVLLAGVSFFAGTLFNKVRSLEGGKEPAVAKVTPPPQAAARPTPAVLGAEQITKLAESGQVKGNKDAKVTIVEFSDFECPFCSRYSTETFPQIDKAYIQTGKVRYVFHNFPLPMHANAQKAAEAAECAGAQGKFWEVHDKLFASQENLTLADLKQYAVSLGLKTADFNTCLDSGKFKDDVAADLSLGQSVGVSGTPAFFINGKLISGAMPFENFKQAIEAELAK